LFQVFCHARHQFTRKRLLYSNVAGRGTGHSASRLYQSCAWRKLCGSPGRLRWGGRKRRSSCRVDIGLYHGALNIALGLSSKKVLETL
jgi:hypothetical protein